jgi:hypothetical protein
LRTSYLTEITKIQEWFSITEEAIKELREQHLLIKLESMTIDDEHPPPDALGCNLSSSVQSLFTPVAWNKIQDSCKCTLHSNLAGKYSKYIQ